MYMFYSYHLIQSLLLWVHGRGYGLMGVVSHGKGTGGLNEDEKELYQRLKNYKLKN